MTIEIGFGNPWWITTQAHYPTFTLRSRGWFARGCFSGLYIRIQIARIVIILTLPPRFFVKSRARFAILIGLVYSI